MNRFIIWMYSKKRISFDIRFRCVPIGRTFFLHHFAYFLFQPPHNLFFQSGNIGLRNPQNIRHLLLRFFLCFRQNTKAHFYNPPLPSAQLLHGILQKLSVNLILNILRDDIVLRPQNIGSSSSFPSQSTFSGSSMETSVFVLLFRLRYIRISFSIQREA